MNSNLETPPSNEDDHLLIGPSPIDLKAADESCAIDAAADRQWFIDNPVAMVRERPATIRELNASGQMPGTLAVICRGPMGSQVRIFIDPPVSKN